MKVTFGARSDVGLARQFNEDCYLVDEDLGLFVVADGMGGTAGGEIASRMACDEIHDHITKNYEVVRQFEAGKEGVGSQAVSEVLVGAVHQACAAVHGESQRDKNLAGMGTTTVVLLTTEENIFIAHVGDSRVYLLRAGAVHQLTRDHSLVEELKKLGKISSSDQVRAKYRNAITRAVGIYESVQVDVLDLVPLLHDRFLLCSDGLHSTTEEEDLARILADKDADEAADNLIRHANSKGGKDNITAVLVDIDETEPERAALTQRKIATLRSVPLFRYLSFEELLKVISLIKERSFGAGETVFCEGEKGDALYVLLTGEVEVLKKEEKIATLKAGDHFGELSLIDSWPRSATIRATEPSLCLVMDQQQFYDVVRMYDAVSVKLLWSLARVCSVRLRQTTDELGIVKSMISQVKLKEEQSDLFQREDK